MTRDELAELFAQAICRDVLVDAATKLVAKGHLDIQGAVHAMISASEREEHWRPFVRQGIACVARLEAMGMVVVPRAAIDELLASEWVEYCQECGIGQTDGWKVLKLAAETVK